MGILFACLVFAFGIGLNIYFFIGATKEKKKLKNIKKPDDYQYRIVVKTNELGENFYLPQRIASRDIGSNQQDWWLNLRDEPGFTTEEDARNRINQQIKGDRMAVIEKKRNTIVHTEIIKYP